jgi:CRISPR-associated protein (TIGR03984 family)
MNVLGCIIEEIKDAEDALTQIMQGKVPKDIIGIDIKWLLIHQDDGVIWGLRVNDGWRLSSDLFPGVSPALSSERVQQIRAFGDEGELLVWHDSNQFRGRIIKDASNVDHPRWARGIDESFILLGNRVYEATKEDFTLIGNASGSRHAVPISCTNEELRDRNSILSLAVRHFLTQDPETGCVRIAATRLVGIKKEAKK